VTHALQGRICAAAADARQHPLWQSFAGAALERDFRIWHSQQLSKARGLLPPFPASQSGLLPTKLWRVCMCVGQGVFVQL
jgi:hypothetical protein